MTLISSSCHHSTWPHDCPLIKILHLARQHDRNTLASKESYRIFYNQQADQRDRWRSRNRYYHACLQRLVGYIIPASSHVMEVGCGSGDLLAGLSPTDGVGVDHAESMVSLARSKYPNLTFKVLDAEQDDLKGPYDYVVMSDLLGTLWDIQKALRNVGRSMDHDTKLIITSHNYWWEPILRLAELIGLKSKQPKASWLTVSDIRNLLHLEGMEIIKSDRKILCPVYIPILSWICNVVLVNLPFINRLGLVNLISARKVERTRQEHSISIVVPARNEKGNIEQAILRTPTFGSHQEFIFIEGHSQDETFAEMQRVQKQYPDRDIKIMQQSGKGKGNAVREAFSAASGDILMILDADLTTPPEDMPKFYEALVQNKGEFINGCRLVYPMEKQAMRFLNFLANKFFGVLFTYLLGQSLKDTLCGTKVLFKDDYLKIAENRSYFGDFDPFGDFDLLFGAAKLNMKIVEVIVRYRDRSYGSTQISRFKHGWLLLKMSAFAAKKIKFIS